MCDFCCFQDSIVWMGNACFINIHVRASDTPLLLSLFQVKITTITNQNWDLPKHHGNIVASNNRYLAYVLEGRSGYVIRLIQNESNNRVLLKGFVGAILDVSFAHATSNLLSCVDEGGNVHIWDLDRVKDFSNIQEYPITHSMMNVHNVLIDKNVSVFFPAW